MNNNEWKVKKLSDLADYINGFAFKPEDWGKDGLPIIRIEQLKNPTTIVDYFSGHLDEKNIIHNGDLIFSWSASLFLRIWQYGDAALNQHLFKVVEKEWVDRVLLKYFIEFYLPEMTKVSHGSTMQHITRKELSHFCAPFPSKKPEQSKIAEILYSVDRAIEQTEALITKQQRIKTGLMQDLLTRGIDENGNIRSEETHQFKDSPLGRIPVEWSYDLLGKCSNIHNNLRKPISALVRESMIGEYPYYGPTGILDYINEFRVEGRYVLIGEDGDHFLKYSFQEMTQLVNGKYNVNNHAHILSGNETVLTEWLYFYYMHKDITFYLTRQGAGRFKLNKATLLNLPIIYPRSVDEQIQVVQLINSHRLVQAQYIRNLNKLQSLKTALMQDLLTGNVRVTPLLEEETVSV